VAEEERLPPALSIRLPERRTKHRSEYHQPHRQCSEAELIR